jgi:hypothetical protein
MTHTAFVWQYAEGALAKRIWPLENFVKMLDYPKGNAGLLRPHIDKPNRLCGKN